MKQFINDEITSLNLMNMSLIKHHLIIYTVMWTLHCHWFQVASVQCPNCHCSSCDDAVQRAAPFPRHHVPTPAVDRRGTPYRYAPVHFRFLRHFGRLYVNDDVSKMSTPATDPVARVGLPFHRLRARALGYGAVSPISPCCAPCWSPLHYIDRHGYGGGVDGD